MCGIVGLFAKTPKIEPELGAHLSAMLGVMCDRGPDSAGFAIYGDETPGAVKLTLRAPDGYDFDKLAADVRRRLGVTVEVERRGTHAVLTIPQEDERRVRADLARGETGVEIVGAGRRMELFKEVGLPPDVARRFKLDTMTGTHGIGHTRMATESAVTTAGAHPFSTGLDQCLVHNGSLSNHRGVRRDLERHGVPFATDNDTEVAAAYVSHRMANGDTLGDALEAGLKDLDGFYTFVVGTERGFGVLRDPIACKPAVMAETGDYVAFGSEYRVLVDLPGVESAKVWEPEPAKVYFWRREA